MCAIVFTGDCCKNREKKNFTYSCLHASPVKVVSVDNIKTNNHFYNPSKQAIKLTRILNVNFK